MCGTLEYTTFCAKNSGDCFFPSEASNVHVVGLQFIRGKCTTVAGMGSHGREFGYYAVEGYILCDIVFEGCSHDKERLVNGLYVLLFALIHRFATASGHAVEGNL